MSRYLPILILLLGLSLVSAGVSANSPAKMPNTLFARAIKNDSTSPNYVLITVVNDNTGKQEEICTLAPFLLGAIHKQRRIPYTDAGEQKAIKLALSNPDHVFHFSNRAALANLPVTYTKARLSYVQKCLAGMTAHQIWLGLSKGTLYRQYHLSAWGADQTAIAYVLLGRGLLPGMQDITGQIYVSE